MSIRDEDKEILIKACKMLSAICKEHKTCAGCPFEREDKDGYFDCILDKPPAEFDTEDIIKCFT